MAPAAFSIHDCPALSRKYCGVWTIAIAGSSMYGRVSVRKSRRGAKSASKMTRYSPVVRANAYRRLPLFLQARTSGRRT